MIAAPLTESQAVHYLEDYQESVRALIESRVFQMVVVKSERLRLVEWGDISYMDTDEAQEILNEAISPLAEYQSRKWECAKCRDQITKQLKAKPTA